MFTRIATVLLTVSACIGPVAFAGGIPSCSLGQYAGSYIRLGNGYIDQLELHNDGTAAWFQSTAIDYLVTGGTYIRQVGSWKCVSATRLIVTTVGEDYTPVQTNDPFNNATITDEYRHSFMRITHQLDIVSVNWLNRTRRVIKHFDLADNPVTSMNATQTEDIDTQATFQRVVPLAADLP